MTKRTSLPRSDGDRDVVDGLLHHQAGEEVGDDRAAQSCRIFCSVAGSPVSVGASP